MNPRAQETLRRIRDGEEPYPPMWANAGLRLVEFERGRITMTARADSCHANAFGAVHGGYAATVLDTVLGLAVFTSLDEHDDCHTTVDLSVKIVRPLPLREDLLARSELVHISRSIGVSQAQLTGRDGMVYAHGTTTCHIRRAG